MLIDPFQADWLTDLLAHYASLPTDARLHLLIDSAFMPGLFRELDQKPLLLFESLPGCSEETRDVSPFVVEFEPNDRSIRHALSRCDGFPMVSAIATFEAAERLAERLAVWCVVEADGQRFNLRFPDTRRLPDIFGVLTDQQRVQIAGNIIAWRYIGRNGNWSELPNEPHAGEFPIALEAKLDEGQFKRLIKDSEPDEMWARLAYRGVTTNLLPSRRHALLSSALSLARERNIDDIDTVLWCAACMNMDEAHDTASLQASFTIWTIENARTNDDVSPTTA